MRTYINILAVADTQAITFANLAGDEYIVVPCVALVEGVLMGAAASGPELALADEFGKIAVAWNGRPLVLNHPKIGGQFVSASQDPKVQEDWAMGQIFNARVEDKKLKVDAWINKTRVQELGGEFEEITALIESGELIEVSTGLFCDLIEQRGTYQGQQYEFVWTNVVPDHLAILSVGTIGACSIEDGCGIPRLNQQQIANVNKSMPEMRIHMSKANEMRQSNDKPAECSCGGGSKQNSQEVNSRRPSEVPENNTAQVLERFETNMMQVKKFSPNSYPANMPDKNVRILLANALKTMLESEGDYLWDLYMFTNEVVVYESWNVTKKMQIAFNIDDSNKVTFTGEPQEVVILSQLVPVTNSGEAPEANADGNGDDNKETEMKDNVQDQTKKVEGSEGDKKSPATNAKETAAEPGAEGSKDTEVAVEKEIEVNNDKGSGSMNLQDYISNAPPEVRAVLNSAIAQRTQKRKEQIDAIKANKANKFSDAALEAMDDETLDNLAVMAGHVVSYAGNLPAQIEVNSEDDDAVPEAPKVFVKKTKEAA